MLTFEVDEDRTGEPGRSLLKAPQSPPPGTPDYNMAPTKQAPVVLTRRPRGEPEGEPVRQLRLLTWGLVPSWSTDPGGAVRMINARSESLFGKPAFSAAARARRALVPADGWYEWQASRTATDAKGNPRKQPFYISRADGAPIAFAGLYEFWRDPTAADPGDAAAWLTTFTILTRAAEPGLDRIHDRQPFVLESELWAAWLDPAVTADAEVEAMLRADPGPGRFVAHPVGRAVSSARNNGPHLLDPAPVEELIGVLDPMTGEILGGDR